ncbi:MAG: hypothetical protein A2358_00520 [Candidatus Staskawiczbacteria bacterium RIFOXYB1_FULL_37_44]|uniref:Phosphoribosyltransferase domain-containing protein n=1 Tax=Candidatus Staskawiczbacteria bacterium RIFOXYB1_FULL_37_44 TaxID=1802223 RepID=A0A1G2IYL3_9BACT|nr:MAG: hypothetical protein A2358_00520 [Candidatus Staskawiczbacteria bacterium RIFOXYB1_FULL_37_44]OGZ83495.1 MAG: hypothetical protein A2416_04185 [Candidatus Staskawiczbacteria bacterium RIFOXYC1_FULL_37_52]OGZ87934.1 MAG: hypothetical protein A2444_02200 [Candidatus Staskawiczbacteria bacterium RIFOXYC2_FULL_37_19]OGZ90167.1 MAG: hypothetical protein A2581_02015 [Candidatus Staskawiczbacteria bacterium RIFOXYD1_FULL_37_110]
MRKEVNIEGNRHLETLANCDGYYECPKNANGQRLGPLVGYAGKYQGLNSVYLQWVGDIYANFSKAEIHPRVLRFFATCLIGRINQSIGLDQFDAFCGAPIGGYSLADLMGAVFDDVQVIKAEKKVVALASPTSREKSELIFARHGVEKSQRFVIVEDVCNNFSTTADLIKLIMASGGVVAGIACFLNRSLTVDDWYTVVDGAPPWNIPVVSLVRKPINEWRQDDPAVKEDIAKGNVVWKPKDEWGRLKKAMQV